MKFLHWCVILSISAISFFSCQVSKPSYIFKNIKKDTLLTNLKPKEYLKIKKSDILTISISSLSKSEDVIFLQENTQSSDSKSSIPMGYVVDEEGFIQLHKIGKVKAAGLSRFELKSEIEKELLPYLKDPLVTVNFSNHFVTVVGEVNKPQVLNMPEERISMIDLLAQSGSLNAAGQLNDVMIIRQQNDTAQEVKHLNLEDHSIFNSSWYYLQPNDIVLVRPDEKKVIEEAKRLNYQRNASLLIQTITVAVVLYQVFIKK